PRRGARAPPLQRVQASDHTVQYELDYREGLRKTAFTPLKSVALPHKVAASAYARLVSLADTAAEHFVAFRAKPADFFCPGEQRGFRLDEPSRLFLRLRPRESLRSNEGLERLDTAADPLHLPLLVLDRVCRALELRPQSGGFGDESLAALLEAGAKLSGVGLGVKPQRALFNERNLERFLVGEGFRCLAPQLGGLVGSEPQSLFGRLLFRIDCLGEFVRATLRGGNALGRSALDPFGLGSVLLTKLPEERLHQLSRARGLSGRQRDRYRCRCCAGVLDLAHHAADGRHAAAAERVADGSAGRHSRASGRQFGDRSFDIGSGQRFSAVHGHSDSG